ncbi:MAG: hypothetical protein JO144_01265, partial [Actinobacteria bacterium]|nr:hypothetical protein [Actinomycetota bacterium]
MPTGHGTPPAGYQRLPRAPRTKPGGLKTTPATVTNPQGDTLAVTNVRVGSFNNYVYTDIVGGGPTGYYYENCNESALAFGGTL